MKIQHKWWALFSVVAVMVGSGLAVAGISTTKHNLSASGTGTYKATSENQLCIYCHAPHNTNPSAGLWNHTMSGATYTPYSSQTLAAAAPGQPTGSSKLCLSCHDGTVALGSVKNLPLSGGQSGVITGLLGAILGTSASNLGTDLRNDHPISFNYDAALLTKNSEIINPAALTGRFRPETDQMQCSNCHDPHSDANPKFMLTGYQDGTGEGSPLCKTCHAKQYWDSVPNNAHRTSTAQWNGTGTNPWHIDGQNLPNNANSTPKANGCESCHQPHNGASTEHLLKKPGTNQSSVCLTCHNGSVGVNPTVNIDLALSKASHHPAKDPAYANRHQSKRMADGKVREDQANFGNSNRHAECTDCHNPHAAAPGRSPDTSVTTNLTNSLAPPTLKGVWGVQPTWGGNWTDIAQYGGYTIVDDVQYTYQVCFKCHSSYAFGTVPPPDPSGKVAGGYMSDQAKEFNPNNKSFHPAVGFNGKNDFIFTRGSTTYNYSAALLIGGTAPAQTIQVSCLECHSNRDPLANEPGPKGIHGSNVWPILWAAYDKTTGRIGTQTHLCFKCHDYGIYVAGRESQWTKTGFNDGQKSLHAYHVGKEDIPCTGCHSAVPHGMSNNHLLIFGTGTNKTPAPYNNHGYTGYRSSAWGLNSAMNLDAIQSGTWQKDYCHQYSMGGNC